MGKYELSGLLSTLTLGKLPAISAKQRRDLNYQVSPGLYHCLPISQIHRFCPATPSPCSQRHEPRSALVESYDYPDSPTRSRS